MKKFNFLPVEHTPYNLQLCTRIPRVLLSSVPEEDICISIKLERVNYCISEKIPSVPVCVLARIPLGESYPQSIEHEDIICDLRVREIRKSEEFEHWITANQLFSRFSINHIYTALLLKDMCLDYWKSYKVFTVQSLGHSDSSEQNSPITSLALGVIKKMTVTVIFEDFTKNFSSAQINSANPENGMVPVNWILIDILREAFKTYSLQVKSNTIIDFRNCPFLTIINPAVAFVYVNECTFTNNQVDAGKISRQTKIKISSKHDIQYFKRIISSVEPVSLPGLEVIYKELSRPFNSELEEIRCGGFILAGVSGSGKTHLINEVGRKNCAVLFTYKLKDQEKNIRQNPYEVMKKMKKLFLDALYLTKILGYPVMISIEGIDTLHVKGDARKSQTGPRNTRMILAHLVQLLDESWTSWHESTLMKKGSFVVIGSTSKPFLIPDILRTCHRFHRELYINVPNFDERLGILKVLQNENSCLDSIDINWLAKTTPGYIASDLVRLVHSILLKSNEMNCCMPDEEHVKFALKKVLPSVLESGFVGSTTYCSSEEALENIGGLESVKLELIKAIIWPLTKPQAFRRLGILPSNGVILYGPSGCGKTSMLRALASSHQANFLSLSSAELFSSAVGESEQIIAHLFHRARMASPCILFFDELDAVVGSREGKTSGGKTVNEAILSMMLTEMDGIGSRQSGFKINSRDRDSFEQRVIVVGATNRPDMIDSALMRPGRFDHLIPVPPPQYSDRLKILQLCTKDVPLCSNVDLSELAEKTECFSGADITNLCREGALLAMAENIHAETVDMKHYLKALSKLSPSISSEYLTKFYDFVSRGSSISSTEILTRKFSSLAL